MSVQALSWVLDEGRGIDAARRMVLVALANNASSDGFAWSSLETIADVAECSRDTARRALADAVRRGWLVEVAQDDDSAPAAWRSLRADRRPRCWRFTGLQSATPRVEDQAEPPTERAPEPTDGGYGVATGSRRGRDGVAQLCDPIPVDPVKAIPPGGGADAPAPALDASSGSDPPIVARLVAGYVTDFRARHRGRDPSRAWRDQAGKAAKQAIADGEPPEVIEACLGAIARENKAPSTLPHVVADYWSQAS